MHMHMHMNMNMNMNMNVNMNMNMNMNAVCEMMLWLHLTQAADVLLTRKQTGIKH